VETIPSSGSATSLPSQLPSQLTFPKQLIEEPEQVSGRESRSKSETWTRSRAQYDDPETIQDVYESPEDISTKVCLTLIFQ
jgi:hypothetical protein